MELVIMIITAVFIFMYRKNPGSAPYKYFTDLAGTVYEKYAPYSYKVVKEKAKELGQDYSMRQYIVQVALFGGVAAAIAFLYFYSLLWAIVYAGIAIMFVPYVNFLRYKRIYNEYIFEEIQVYCTNVIMEFNTSQSFVKSLEGVRESGILEEPIKGDVSTMIDMSYANGTIDEALKFMSDKYPYYMVKNMHQLFLQITNEGAKDSGESLELMMQDIDMLVEGVYRDKMDRAAFYKKFVMYGLALYLLVMLMQLLLGQASYIEMINMWFIQIILHAIIWINSYFLLNGTKFYNEDIGAE
ncbi:MAG TPA: hypothetical protein DCY94_02815 [Firmicutes bacterium]|nr:hypothetical protein [Bacillota bacterium]